MQDIRKFDKSNLLKVTDNFPDDSLIAWNNSQNSEILNNLKPPDNILISAMGGSCISADLLKSYIFDKSDIPVIINRSPDLPGFISEKSLAVFISYSGNTFETLNSLKKAIEKKSQIICISRGGKMQQICQENNIPLLLISGESKMPRAAVGELFYSLAGILSAIKTLNISKSEIEGSLNSLAEIRNNYSLNYNPDNSLFDFARELSKKQIVIYGSSPYTEAVSLRWKTQFNENSKSLVIYNVFPELTHNETVGLANRNLADYYFIFLRDKKENNYLKNQIDVSISLLENTAGIREFYAEGNNLIERMMKLLYIGDYLSIYLALLNGIDPTPIEAIMSLKEKLEASLSCK